MAIDKETGYTVLIPERGVCFPSKKQRDQWMRWGYGISLFGPIVGEEATGFSPGIYHLTNCTGCGFEYLNEKGEWESAYDNDRYDFQFQKPDWNSIFPPTSGGWPETLQDIKYDISDHRWLPMGT